MPKKRKFDNIEIQEIKQRYRELAKEKFIIFVKQTWDIVEKASEFINSWHIECICEHLEAQAKGEKQLQKIIVNVPPRHSKSKICSVLYPCWLWLRNPSEQIMTISNSSNLATDFTVESRYLIQSDLYKLWSNELFSLQQDVNAKSKYWNDKGGRRQAFGINSSIFGSNASTIILDDPNDPKGRDSEKTFESTINSYKGAIRSRQNNPKTNPTKFLLIQQRLGMRDLTQFVEENENDWFKLVLPCEYDPKYTFISPINFNDKREKEGELLCPKRFTPDYFYPEKKDPFNWATLFQQQPSVTQGNIVKQKWFKIYSEPIPENLFSKIIYSVDTSYGEINGDFTAIVKLGVQKQKVFVLDIIREILTFPEQLELLKSLNKDNPEYDIVIEKATTGSPLAQMLSKEIQNLYLMPVVKSKHERLNFTLPYLMRGEMYFPDSSICSKIHYLINELVQFPVSQYDDCVDAWDQGIQYLKEVYNTNILNLNINTEEHNSHLYNSKEVLHLYEDKKNNPLEITTSKGLFKEELNIFEEVTSPNIIF